MHNCIGLIALDLDGTLLNSRKELSPGNRAALEEAAAAGVEIVPCTGRFYDAMPSAIRDLPFVRYAITINGSAVADLRTGQVIYRCEIPCAQAIELMAALDQQDVIYDCYQDNGAYMTAALKARAAEYVKNPIYLDMIRSLRRDVPELKDWLRQRQRSVQKIQFFSKTPELRLQLLQDLPQRFPHLCVSSAVEENVEITAKDATKGQALLALAAHLGLPQSATMAFGDGLNDLSLVQSAGIGVAMANACRDVLSAADYVTASCDEDGVAAGIRKFCLTT